MEQYGQLCIDTMEHCWKQDPNDRPIFAAVVDAIKSFQRVSNDENESEIRHDRKNSVDDLSPEEKERMRRYAQEKAEEKARARAEARRQAAQKQEDDNKFEQSRDVTNDINHIKERVFNKLYGKSSSGWKWIEAF